MIACVFAAKFCRYVKELIVEKSDGSHSLFSIISPGHKRDGQHKSASSQLSSAKDLDAAHVLALLGDAILIINGHEVYDDTKSKEWNITTRVKRLLSVSPDIYLQLLGELPKSMWKDDLRTKYVDASQFPFGNFLKASISAMGKCALVWTETGNPKDQLVGDIKTPLKRARTLREGFIGTSPEAEFADNTVHYNITPGDLVKILQKKVS